MASSVRPFVRVSGASGSNVAQQTSQEFPFDSIFSRLSLRGGGVRFVRVLGRVPSFSLPAASHNLGYLRFFRISVFRGSYIIEP